jgi:hypothetical protein
MALNQLDPSFADLLPRSDSRFNPAQRALEEGRLDEAERAKLALETRQRARNRAREERGERWTPRFFAEREDGEGYVYKGGYWEARRDVRLTASKAKLREDFLTDRAPRANSTGHLRGPRLVVNRTRRGRASPPLASHARPRPSLKAASHGQSVERRP